MSKNEPASNKLQLAISKLAAMFNGGELLADTDPVAFIETVAHEIVNNRAILAAREKLGGSDEG